MTAPVTLTTLLYNHPYTGTHYIHVYMPAVFSKILQPTTAQEKSASLTAASQVERLSELISQSKLSAVFLQAGSSLQNKMPPHG